MGIKQDIQEAVSTEAAMTYREIAAALGRKYSTWFKKHVDDLAKLGILTVEQRKRPNGRPAKVFKLRQLSVNTRDFRSEWLLWCEDNMPIHYDLWLEQMLKEERENRLRGG